MDFLTHEVQEFVPSEVCGEKDGEEVKTNRPF